MLVLLTSVIFFMLTEKQLKLFYKRIEEEYFAGVECVFIKLDRTTGLKIYSSKEERDYAYDLQKKIYEDFDLAPPVYTKFELKHFKSYYNDETCSRTLEHEIDSKLFGYVTHVANAPSHYSTRFHGMFDKLIKEADACGIDTSDISEENVGYYKNKLVLIDFGMVSMDEMVNK